MFRSWKLNFVEFQNATQNKLCIPSFLVTWLINVKVLSFKNIALLFLKVQVYLKGDDKLYFSDDYFVSSFNFMHCLLFETLNSTS